MTRSRWPSWESVRSKTLFFAGLAVLAYEVVIKPPLDLAVIPIVAGMLGLESFLKRDERATSAAADPNDNALAPPPPDPAASGGAASAPASGS